MRTDNVRRISLQQAIIKRKKLPWQLKAGKIKIKYLKTDKS